MADDILRQPADTSPPPDTVLLWLTRTVELDFVERGVFPMLRSTTARGFRATASLHYLTADEARAVLADAVARKRGARRGLLHAFKALVSCIEAAMREAAERRSILEATQAVCVRKDTWREQWIGTKAQLKAQGITLTGPLGPHAPWPGEEGGRERWALGRDSRGWTVSISRFSRMWPGLYGARIAIPHEVRNSQHDDDADRARRILKDMPRTADDYRAQLVEGARICMRVTLQSALKPASWHGYTLDEDVIDEIDAGFDAVVEAIIAAKVHFDPARHAQIEQQCRAQIAAADGAFRQQLAALTKPNPSLLEGRKP